MSIEVRQLVIKSQVGTEPVAPVRGAVSARELEQAKAQLLAECKAWLRERLQEARER